MTMRKGLCLLLCLLLPLSALAGETLNVQPSFTPAVYPLADWGVSLSLPEDWSPLELLSEDTDRGVVFAAADATANTNLTVTALTLDGEGDIAAAQALLEAQADSQDIEPVTLGDLTYLAYNREQAEEFGFLLPLDGGVALDFRFACSPEDADALGTLPLEIIAAVRLEDAD